MNSLQQIIERESPIYWNDDFSVEHELVRLERLNRVDQLGKVPLERLARLRLKLDLLPVAECETPEAVPLWLVLPAVVFGDRLDGARFHRHVGRFDGQAHVMSLFVDKPTRFQYRSSL